jgi:hypothetical protein
MRRLRLIRGITVARGCAAVTRRERADTAAQVKRAVTRHARAPAA